VSSRSAATRYARAIFDVALKEGDVQQVGGEIAEFAELVASHETLKRVLSNPAVPVQRKRAVIEQLLAAAGVVSPIVSKVLLLLADKDRLVLLPEIADAYRDRLMDHAKIVRAQVTTATAVPADRLAALQQGLARATGRQVQLENRVDGSIIGGAVARIGSMVFDGSVTRQLEKLREALVSSST
jgi:F-type H+-transporting ATPase subunit delta